MFGLGRAFKTRSYYVFDYTPRYYDKRKERLEKLEEKYSKENQSENEDDDVTIAFSKENLKNAWRKSKKRSSDNKSTRRLALIITILVGIVVYMFDLHTLF